MDKEDRFIIIVILAALLSLTLLFSGSQNEVVGETPCVDGMKRVNLEGIMCEDLKHTWFGLNEYWMILSLIPLILPLIIIQVKGGKKK